MLLIVAGFHVPTIPLGDVVGNVGATAPKQNGGISGKLGVINCVTFIVKVCDVAHTPRGGVK